MAVTNEQHKLKARRLAREQIFEWYVSVAGCMPAEQVEDTKAYRDTVCWYLEPPIPGVDNPILIEENIQGVWSIRTEKRIVPIRSFGGI